MRLHMATYLLRLGFESGSTATLGQWRTPVDSSVESRSMRELFRVKKCKLFRRCTSLHSEEFQYETERLIKKLYVQREYLRIELGLPLDNEKENSA